jgi:hypothetical protein
MREDTATLGSGAGLRGAEMHAGHVCANRTGRFAPGPPGPSPREKFDAIAAQLTIMPRG